MDPLSGWMPVPTERLAREISIAVVEEHEILRCGLVACFLEEPFVALTVDGHEDQLGHEADVAVVSSEAARRHKFRCPIVVCSDEPDGPQQVAEGNDVAGVVHRESVTVAQLHATVRAAAAGLRVRPNIQPGERNGLDARSLRLVQLVAEGLSTREIADRMTYSEQTIKKLITTVQGRMEARSRAHMVALAIRRGLI
jgi:DNA-binding NarL/FixJ family response regulator